MDLYHVDIKLPEGFVSPTARVRLVWSKHAERARANDRYGVIPKFENIPLSAFRVIEVGMEAGAVKKIVVRGNYDNKRDVVFVLIPTTRTSYFVKTVWFNMRDDRHISLDHTRYVH